MLKYYRRNFVEKVLPANLALFMFRPITVKRLNSLTAIDRISQRGDLAQW